MRQNNSATDLVRDNSVIWKVVCGLQNSLDFFKGAEVFGMRNPRAHFRWKKPNVLQVEVLWMGCNVLPKPHEGPFEA